MAEELNAIYDKLEEIRISLRKLGPDRRNLYTEHVKEKFVQAKELYESYKRIIEISLKEILLREESTKNVLDTLINDIQKSYKIIESYCCVSSKIKENSKMETFDLRTAANLLPVMDGREETIEKLIDSIDLYNSCLKEQTCKKLLALFVIKTRLTKSAKLKLKSEYNSCDDLVKDMRVFLLTKKSSNSLLTQLNNVSQNNMTIAQYATKIEELFVDLTISQANSNEKAYEILRPLNEQIAVKKFADGLRNRRLSTIISARNYMDLKDAVRAAQDEEVSQPSTFSNSILNVNMRGKFYKPCTRARGGYHYNGSRGHFNNYTLHGNNQKPRGSYFNSNRSYQNNNGNYRARQMRGAPMRSSRGRITHGRGYQRNNINFVDQEHLQNLHPPHYDLRRRSVRARVPLRAP